MIKKILIANRSDKTPIGGAAAKPNSIAAASRAGYFNAEKNNV